MCVIASQFFYIYCLLHFLNFMFIVPFSFFLLLFLSHFLHFIYEIIYQVVYQIYDNNQLFHFVRHSFLLMFLFECH
jgi:hypothetical protein